MQTRSIAVLLALATSGCAIVHSVPANSGSQGVGYMLPQALLPVELVQATDGIDIRVGSPVYVGDPGHAYVLQRSANVFSSDNVAITVDPATGLLSAIKVQSEDETLPAVVKLVAGLHAESASEEPAVFFRGMLNPGWTQGELDAFNGTLNEVARMHVGQMLSASCGKDSNGEACAAARSTDVALQSGRFSISLDTIGKQAATPADCSTGFCYRMNLPQVVTVRGGGTSISDVFRLPNLSTTFVMPLERWAFVKTTHDVALTDGVLKSITTDRPSSALAVASAPLDVVEATLKTISEVVQLKVDVSGKEKALSDAKVAEIQAKSALDKALLDKDTKGKTESAVFRAAANLNAALSLHIGVTRTGDSATQDLKGANPLEQKTSGTSSGKTSAGNDGTGSK